MPSGIAWRLPGGAGPPKALLTHGHTTQTYRSQLYMDCEMTFWGCVVLWNKIWIRPLKKMTQAGLVLADFHLFRLYQGIHTNIRDFSALPCSSQVFLTEFHVKQVTCGSSLSWKPCKFCPIMLFNVSGNHNQYFCRCPWHLWPWWWFIWAHVAMK